jgi:hypothetical protein
MTYSPKGKYVTVDPDNPRGVAICDHSRFVVNADDLVPQMEWYGDSLKWTGMLVAKRFLDEPNPQLRPPILAPDPIPMRNPRPMLPTVITWSNNYNIPWELLTGPEDNPVDPLDRSPYQGIVASWDIWVGNDNGMPAATDIQRRQALEAGVFAPLVPVSAGSIAPQPYLTEPEIRRNLENFVWGT